MLAELVAVGTFVEKASMLILAAQGLADVQTHRTRHLADQLLL